MKGREEILSKLTEITDSSSLLSNGSGIEAFDMDGLSPKWAIFPKTREEVRKIVGLCQAESLSIIPRGNGTKIGIGNIPRRADLVISTRHLDRVVDQDCENLTITLESGVLLSDIQERLRSEGIGYFIPLDPPFTDAATLGGILATHSSGPKRLLYGTARDLVLGMKVVLADGGVISCGGKTVKNVSGYDMAKLFIGSFGTLGIIIEATLRLLPLPEKEHTFVAAFQKAESAFEVIKEILKSQLIPSSIEILNFTVIRETGANLPYSEGDYFLAGAIEGAKEAVQRQIKEIHEITRRYLPRKTELLEGHDQSNLWKTVRDSSLRLRTRWPESALLKMSVPISKTAVAFAASEAIAAQEGFPCALWGHAGSGILYVGLPFGERTAESNRVIHAIHQLTGKAVALGGNLVIEAAPVWIKKQINVWGKEGSDLPVFRQLKSQLDPSCLFNPGKFVGGI